jgi:hypothetical protein
LVGQFSKTLRKHLQGSVLKKKFLFRIFLTKREAMVNKNIRLSNSNSKNFVALSRQFLLTLASRFVKNRQHKNNLCNTEAWSRFLKVLLSWPTKNFEVRVIFSEKSRQKVDFYFSPFLLPFGGLAIFIAFWWASLLC